MPKQKGRGSGSPSDPKSEEFFSYLHPDAASGLQERKSPRAASKLRSPKVGTFDLDSPKTEVPLHSPKFNSKVSDEGYSAVDSAALPEDLDADDGIPHEVAAVVSSTDDPTLPALTFRVWVIGTLFTILAAAAGQFYYFRSATLALSNFFIQLGSYPLGVAMARILPPLAFNIGRHRLSLNPGPFNQKEHALICICAGTSLYTAYAIDILAVQRIYYKQNIGAIGSILLIWTTQCLGYGFAGLLVKFLVRPANMVWPANLPIIALFNTLHGIKVPPPRRRHRPHAHPQPAAEVDPSARATVSPTTSRVAGGATGAEIEMAEVDSDVTRSLISEAAEDQAEAESEAGMSQLLFFGIVFVATFFYEFIPGFIAPALQSISLLCIFGGGLTKTMSLLGYYISSGFGGAGLLSFSLDWNYIGVYSPLYTPFWVLVNVFGSVILFTYIITPLLWRYNFWHAQAFPMLATGAFNNDVDGLLTAKKFEFHKVVDPITNTVDPAKLAAYGPLRLSPFWAIGYGLSFLTLTATLSHVLLFDGPEIYKKFRASRTEHEEKDLHSRLMRVYKETPRSWYLWVMLGSTLFSLYVCWAYPMQLPWWGLLLAILIAGVFVLPIGIIQAVSNIQIGLNVLTEFIIGYILPGRPIANITFKCYGYMAASQCLSLTADQKLGHYMKIPPRSTFTIQIWGTVVGSIVNYVVLEVLLAKFDFSQDRMPDPAWTPRNSRIFMTASLIWGAIGPAKMFGAGTLYHPLLWFFVIGAILPVPFWLIHRKKPHWNMDLVHWPIISSAANNVGAQGGNTLWSAIVISIACQWHVRNKFKRWYDRYNYILSAALDSAGVFASIIIFVVFTESGITMPHWFLNPNPDLTDPEFCNLPDNPRPF